MEAKQLAPYDEYLNNHGLTWPVREVDGKWLGTQWRFADGAQEEGFDEYGVAMYGDAGKAGGVSFYKSAGKKPSVVFRPYEPPAEEPDGEFPFVFCTGRFLEHWHTGSMTRRIPELDRALPEALLYMNPTDAETMGIKDGDLVRITSRFGSCDIKATTANRVEPPAGTVFAPFFAEETLINLVVQDTYCPLSKEPDFKKTCINIVKLVDGEEIETPAPVEFEETGVPVTPADHAGRSADLCGTTCHGEAGPGTPMPADHYAGDVVDPVRTLCNTCHS